MQVVLALPASSPYSTGKGLFADFSRKWSLLPDEAKKGLFGSYMLLHLQVYFDRHTELKEDYAKKISICRGSLSPSVLRNLEIYEVFFSAPSILWVFSLFHH